MDSESVIEFQKIDCNCNDCIFMTRDQERFKKSLNFHHKIQLDCFNMIKNNLFNKVEYWKEKNDIKKAELIKKEADKMKFIFDKSVASINFGFCEKFKKKT